MHPGMVSLANLEVQKQMHALHNFEEVPTPMTPPLDGFEEDEQFE